MKDFKFSAHAGDMLRERNILEEWVWRDIDEPDWSAMDMDDHAHHFKSTDGHGGGILHVVVNPHVWPNRVITVFFDRKRKRKS